MRVQPDEFTGPAAGSGSHRAAAAGPAPATAPMPPAAPLARPSIGVSWWSVRGCRQKGWGGKMTLGHPRRWQMAAVFHVGHLSYGQRRWISVCPADAQALGSHVPVLGSCCSPDTAVPPPQVPDVPRPHALPAGTPSPLPGPSPAPLTLGARRPRLSSYSAFPRLSQLFLPMPADERPGSKARPGDSGCPSRPSGGGCPGAAGARKGNAKGTFGAAGSAPADCSGWWQPRGRGARPQPRWWHSLRPG